MTEEELKELVETITDTEIKFDERLTALENFNDEVKATLEEVGKSLQILDSRLKDVEKWRRS
jgi:DNA-directed RNA polymerase sigma subunit (sigma70/sigma32)